MVVGISISQLRRATEVLAFVALLGGATGSAAAQGAEAAESGPFNGFGGTWTGAGTVQRASGETERLRCRATYQVQNGGNAMQQNLQCSSDTYNFELRCAVEHEAGAVTGTWVETSRNVEGKISGRIQSGEVRVAAQSPQFSASISIQTRGNRQVVSIRSPGTELTNVSITMARKG